MASNYSGIEDGAAATPSLFNSRFEALWKSDVFNVKAYGALGDGVTDDRAAVQDTINAASVVGGIVYFPPGTYVIGGTLYVVYDATSNASYSQSTLRQGAVKLRGAREINVVHLSNASFVGSVLSFTGSASSLVVDADGQSRGYALRNFRIEDLALVASTSTWVVKARNVSQQGGFKGIFVGQSGTNGSGVLWEETHTCTFDRSFIYAPGDYTNTGYGFVVRNTQDGSSGGMITARDVTARGFAKGWQIGHETYGSGKALNNVSLRGCQAKDASYGMLIGHGAKAVNLDSCHFETCTVNGFQVRGNAGTVSLTGAYFENPGATEADMVIGDRTLVGNAADASNVQISGSQFNSIASVGIARYVTSGTLGFKAEMCQFSSNTSGQGIGMDLRTAAGATTTLLRGVRLGPNNFSNLASNMSNHEGAEQIVYSDGYVYSGRNLVRRRESKIAAASVDLTNADCWTLTSGTAVDTITAQDGAAKDVILNSGATLNHGSGNIQLRGGAAIGGPNKAVRLVCNGTNWIES